MAGLGWMNGGPLEVGGDTTKTQDVYAALRAAVGVGGAGPRDGLEDLWRQCKAQAIASSVIATERAVLQALPDHATDHVPVYERILAIVPAGGATEQDRRLAVVEAWTLRLLANMPELKRSLQALDPAFEIEELEETVTTIVLLGRMFPKRGSELKHGVAAFPNFADDFVVGVTYTLGPGQTEPPPAVMAKARRLLNAVLPAWVDWLITTGDGFFTDGGPDGASLLDLKALGS